MLTLSIKHYRVFGMSEKAVVLFSAYKVYGIIDRDFRSDYEIEKYSSDNIFTINNIGLNLREFLDELLIKHVSKNDIKFWNISDTLNETECLVHGDLNSSNILLDSNNKVKAIIDFGFSGFGNKYDDISRVLSRQYPNGFEKEIIKNYEYFSKNAINEQTLNNKVTEWKNIDQAYINYMKSIGIYE